MRKENNVLAAALRDERWRAEKDALPKFKMPREPRPDDDLERIRKGVVAKYDVGYDRFGNAYWEPKEHMPRCYKGYAPPRVHDSDSEEFTSEWVQVDDVSGLWTTELGWIKDVPVWERVKLVRPKTAATVRDPYSAEAMAEHWAKLDY